MSLLQARTVWWDEQLSQSFPTPNAHWFSQLGLPLDILAGPIDSLSTGERQRLALLRVLHNYPKVLLLDEPSANLDADNTKRVEELILGYCAQHQTPSIWISHDPAQLERLSRRIFTMSNGKLEAV